MHVRLSWQLGALAILPFVLSTLSAAQETASGDLVTVVLKEGGKVVGSILKEGDGLILLKLADGTQREIEASKIADFYPGALEADRGKTEEWKPAPVPMHEDDIVKGKEEGKPPAPAQPPKPKPVRPVGEKAQPAGGAKQPEPAKQPELTWVLEIPEYLPQNCPTCGGNKQHECWLCENGVIDDDGEPVKCTLCRGGKSPCLPCGATGDTPNPAKLLSCAGCVQQLPFSLAPGKWLCQSCGGDGHYAIIGGAKHAKCGVCDGTGTFQCVVCAGKAIVPRLFPPPKKASPEDWRKRIADAREAIAAVNLTAGKPVTSGHLHAVSPRLPQLRPLVERLTAQEKQAEALNKNNIEGSGEVLQFVQMASGVAVKLFLEQELRQLKIEEGYLKQTAGAPK